MPIQPKVSVCMITYNHEKFIREAIEGVLMQECNFNVELIVANDCSPDATDSIIQDILKNHPCASWIKYINHKKNLGMMPNFIWALNQCTGKYIALCEGDDYWTDPLKLQKQVDFLEGNKDYIAHSHNVFFRDERNKESIPSLFSKLPSRTLTIEDVCPLRTFHTASLTFKNSAIKNFDFEFLVKKVLSGDKYVYLNLFLHGKMFYDEMPMAFYRRNEGGVSASNSLDKYLNADVKLYNYFEKKVDVTLKNKMVEAANYFEVERFTYLMNKKISLKLVIYYFKLIPIINYSKHIKFDKFKRLSKNLIKKCYK